MSKEIIEVLEYICNKLGIAVDWTSENVWPQVMDVLLRYSQYKVAANIVTMLICIVLMIICIRSLAKIFKERSMCVEKERSNAFWSCYTGEYIACTDIGGVAIVISCVVFLITFILCAVCCSDLLKWIYVPEIQFLDLLNAYLETH